MVVIMIKIISTFTPFQTFHSLTVVCRCKAAAKPHIYIQVGDKLNGKPT